MAVFRPLTMIFCQFTNKQVIHVIKKKRKLYPFFFCFFFFKYGLKNALTTKIFLLSSTHLNNFNIWRICFHWTERIWPSHVGNIPFVLMHIQCFTIIYKQYLSTTFRRFILRSHPAYRLHFLWQSPASGTLCRWACKYAPMVRQAPTPGRSAAKGQRTDNSSFKSRWNRDLSELVLNSVSGVAGHRRG